jgi:hypothetical protein
VFTNSLSWEHSNRVAEAVTSTVEPSCSSSQPCAVTRRMKNTQLRGCVGAGPTAPTRSDRRCEKRAQDAAGPKTRTPGSAAVVKGHLVAVGVCERERAAERPVDGP